MRSQSKSISSPNYLKKKVLKRTYAHKRLNQLIPTEKKKEEEEEMDDNTNKSNNQNSHLRVFKF